MFNELMLNWSCWAHKETTKVDYVNEWGGICFKPSGFLRIFQPSYSICLLLYIFLFTAWQIIDSNDDRVQQMKAFERSTTIFACFEGRKRLRENAF